MPKIEMRRKCYEAPTDNCQHAGLMLERGFTQWDTENNRHAEQRKKFYDNLTAVNVGLCYKTAFLRWQEILRENAETSKTWVGKLDGRLYLGLGEANPLESAVTLHHTYGVPFIPGSAIKGVVRHAFLAAYALSYDAEQKKYRLGEDARLAFEILFGREPDPKRKDDIGNAGYIVFHDAWWIPEKNKNPLTKEIVTVHHQAYYSSKGETPATDFDSPNPNPQLAIQGSFLFSLEGAAEWADFAKDLLQKTLKETGIGAKTASGYGYFIKNNQYPENIKIIWDEILKWLNQQKLKSASPEEEIKLWVECLSLDDLPDKLGKNRNKTKNEVGAERWQQYLSLVKEQFAIDIADWKKSDRNKQKAYQTIFGDNA